MTKMNAEPSPSSLHPQEVRPDELEAALTTNPALVDDLGLDDEKLGPRQEDATRIIVCEGGCE